ncbi:MAG: hypothetical protein K0S32_357 [Bacteroidetes bacterium]|jgi:hypothetical protein|nr:hypothetical protein [Bacteroidota bacterium]
MQPVKETVFKYARIQLFESRFVRVEIYSDELVISHKEAKEMNDAIGELAEGTEIPVMLVATVSSQFDSSAREFSASEEGLRYTKKEALVVKGLGQKIIADFYLKINKPKKPTSTFNTEEDAIRWLLSD